MKKLCIFAKKNMIIDRRTLESICEQLSEKFHLYEYGYHLAAVFENNDSREIVSWAVLDEDNQKDLLEILKDSDVDNKEEFEEWLKRKEMKD